MSVLWRLILKNWRPKLKMWNIQKDVIIFLSILAKFQSSNLFLGTLKMLTAWVHFWVAQLPLCLIIIDNTLFCFNEFQTLTCKFILFYSTAVPNTFSCHCNPSGKSDMMHPKYLFGILYSPKYITDDRILCIQQK